MSLPAGVIPVQDLTTRQILYGSRKTSHRFELLEHDPATGVDSLVGFLDGVKPGGTISGWSGGRVKWDGNLTVLDLPVAKRGQVRIADVDLLTTRIRPVRVIDGLPDAPLGVYVVTAMPEVWSDTGRVFELELHDKTTVVDQDAVEETFAAGTEDPVLSIVQSVVESTGERITVDGSQVLTLKNPLVRPAGTSKLTIVNDLLDAIGYNALTIDGVGNFRATPKTRPALRPIRYTMLNDAAGDALVRELTSGAESVYSPDWKRDRDVFKVPNKVIAVQATGEDEPLVGVATNENPDSEFSYSSRGRWVVPPSAILEGVDVPDFSGEADPDAATVAFLEEKARASLIAQTAVQAAVSVKCLPLPVDLLEAIRFESTPAGIDARHTIRSIDLTLSFDGLMGLELEEVIDL